VSNFKGRIADDRKDLAPALFRAYNSPIATWDDFTSIQPYDWQFALWDACWQYGSQVAMRTCNEAGKSSYTVPVLAAAWAAGFPGGMCVITSNSEDQIKQQLWPSLKAIARRKGWRTAGMTVEAPSVDGVLPGSVIICRVTKEGERFEGYHNKLYPDKEGLERFCPLLMIYDEAKSISEDIFLAGERCNPAAELRISTTGDDSGDFHDSCMSPEWITSNKWNDKDYDFVITWEMCPHLYKDQMTYRRKMSLINRLGRTHPFVMSNLYAEFFRSGTHMVFSEADIAAALRAMNEDRPKIGRHKKAFCDFSGGGDELTFGMREGNYVHSIVAWNRSSETSPSVEAEKYVRLFKEHELHSNEISGDNGGLGAGIISEIKERGYNIHRVNANLGAKDKDQFADKATEDCWDFKQKLHDGMIILPKDDILLKQMQLRQYVMKNTEDNKIRLEPKGEAKKKRNEHSPDRLETVIGVSANMESMPTAEEVSRGAVRTGVPKEYFDKVTQGYNDGAESDFGEEWQ